MIQRFVAILIVLAASTAHADPAAEAGEHFQRGVGLYGEADYSAALVEFRRAYEIAPNPAVLYNIGQTQYQLQNYAAALTVFERYLAEAHADAAHRGEVEKSLATLRTRVGRVAIKTNRDGAEVVIDDEVVGKTPLAPVVVSVGRRRVTLNYPGRSPDTRYIEVAAGDTATVEVIIAEPAEQPAQPRDDHGKSGGTNWVTIGWVTTGVLAAGALVTGAIAFKESRDLDDARGMYPVTADELDSKSTKVKRFALVADILGAAAIVTGAISLRLTLSRSKTHEAHVSIGPGGIQVAGTFK